MIDTVAAIIALIWNGGVAAVTWRWVRDNVLALGLGSYMLSLYAADRILPRVLVDGQRNFDATRTEALRPFLIFPDLVLIGLILLVVRRPSRTAVVLSGALAIAAMMGFVVGLMNTVIPVSAAAFWTTTPLRAAGVLLLVDAGVRRMGWESAARTVIRVLAAGGVFVAAQLLAVWGAKAIADLVGIDLGSVWYAFAHTRPIIPGWNNNIAASAVALGVAGLVLLPRLARIPTWMTMTAIVVGAAALLAAEYRTAIIGMCLAIGARAAIETYDRLAQRVAMPGRLAAGVAALIVVPVVLLSLSAIVVPRLADLNPITYVSGITGAPVETPAVDPNNPDAEAEGDLSTAVRVGINRAALDMWSRDPVVGGGLGAWEFTRPDEPSILQTQITTHSGYLWVLADLGIVGLLLVYIIPIGAALIRRPSAPLLAWVGLVVLFEVAAVGIAHSRYAVMMWSVIGLVALMPVGRYAFLTGFGPERDAREARPATEP